MGLHLKIINYVPYNYHVPNDTLSRLSYKKVRVWSTHSDSDYADRNPAIHTGDGEEASFRLQDKR